MEQRIIQLNTQFLQKTNDGLKIDLVVENNHEGTWIMHMGFRVHRKNLIACGNGKMT